MLDSGGVPTRDRAPSGRVAVHRPLRSGEVVSVGRSWRRIPREAVHLVKTLVGSPPGPRLSPVIVRFRRKPQALQRPESCREWGVRSSPARVLIPAAPLSRWVVSVVTSDSERT